MKKVILITGSTSGLGKLLAERLENMGNIVFAGVRSADDKKSLGILWKGKNILPISLDVTSEESCKKAIKLISKERSGVDILINNAGYTLVGPSDSFTPQDLRNILETNTIGPFRLISYVLPYMKKKKSGQIINVTSLSGLIVFPGFGLYSASKFALEALGKALYYEVRKDNIKVTQVEPGAIKLPDSVTKKIEHLPVRERYWFIKILLPMIKGEQVAERIVDLTTVSDPPQSVILGRDSRLTTLAYKLLPGSIWNKIIEKFCI